MVAGVWLHLQVSNGGFGDVDRGGIPGVKKAV
jgi:hypothetical protein